MARYYRRFVPAVVAGMLVFGVAHVASACVGDCNNDGEVTIDELVTMVNIALETALPTACRAGDSNGDGAVTIEEIIAAVNHALDGCPAPSSCTSATATIVVNFEANEVPNLAGVTLDLAYPSRAVDLPAAELEERVRDVSGAGGFFDAQIVPGDANLDATLRVSYLTLDRIPPGSLLEVAFECTGATSPTADEFSCAIRQASDSGGFDVTGVSCAVVLDVE